MTINLEHHIQILDSRIQTLEQFSAGKNRQQVLEYNRELFILLNELQSYRREDKNLTHGVKDHKEIVVSKKIYEVRCTCGETTRYKIPLDTLSDFVCPNRKVG